MRSGEHRGLPLFPASYTVIEIATGQDHGTFQSWADVAACLVFARLSHEEVEVLSDVPRHGNHDIVVNGRVRTGRIAAGTPFHMAIPAPHRHERLQNRPVRRHA